MAVVTVKVENDDHYTVDEAVVLGNGGTCTTGAMARLAHAGNRHWASQEELYLRSRKYQPWRVYLQPISQPRSRRGQQRYQSQDSKAVTNRLSSCFSTSRISPGGPFFSWRCILIEPIRSATLLRIFICKETRIRSCPNRYFLVPLATIYIEV